MNARFTLAGGLGAALLCGSIIAGCSGGSSSAPSVQSANTGSSAGQPGTSGASSSRTAQVTFSIKIPSRSSNSSAKRNVKYVSPSTTYVQVTAFPDDTVAGSIPCSAGTCSGSVAVPLDTTSLEVQLYDYQGGHLLSEATDPITITPGVANTPLPFVFNGVAASFSVTSTVPSLVIGVPTSIPITVTPEDADLNPIASPGAVIDQSQNVLVSANGTTQTMSLVSSSAHVTVPPLAWNAGSYTLTTTATYDGVDPGGSEQVTLTPTSTVDGSYAQASTFAVNPKAIFLIATTGQQIPSLSNLPAYAVTTSAPSAATTTTIEFAIATPAPTTVYLSVASNFNDAGVPLALSADTCSNELSTGAGADGGIVAAFPSPVPSTPPVPGATMPPSSVYPFTFNAGSQIGSGVCNFTITDTTNNLGATVTMGFDNTQIFVQGKGRK